MTRRETLVLGGVTVLSAMAGGAAIVRRRTQPATSAPVTTTSSAPSSSATTIPEPMVAEETTTSTTTPPAALTVVEVLCRDSWASAPAGAGTPHTIDQITVHHSATRLEDNREVVDHIRRYQRDHQESRGWVDLAYHYVIDARGNVYEARSTDVVGDTSTNYDPTGHFLAMCDGNFDEQDVPEPQFDGLARLLAWGVQEHGLTVESISGHRDHASTACPGQNLYEQVKNGELARRVQAHLAVGPLERRLLCGAEAGQRIDAIQAGA